MPPIIHLGRPTVGEPMNCSYAASKAKTFSIWCSWLARNGNKDALKSGFESRVFQRYCQRIQGDVGNSGLINSILDRWNLLTNTEDHGSMVKIVSCSILGKGHQCVQTLIVTIPVREGQWAVSSRCLRYFGEDIVAYDNWDQHTLLEHPGLHYPVFFSLMLYSLIMLGTASW